MHRNLTCLLLAATLSLAGCNSGSSDARRDTSDFFTRLSQGYRIQVRSRLPADAMWMSVDMKTLEDIDDIDWAWSIAKLHGYIIRNQGVMDGSLFILFRIQAGEILGDAKLCQPVESAVKESEEVHAISQPALRLLRTTHRGKRSNLGTAFRALESFAKEEELKVTGWGTLRVLRGATVEMETANYLTEAQLYLE